MSNIKEYTLQEKKKKTAEKSSKHDELYFQVKRNYTDEESFLWKGGIKIMIDVHKN